jgi:hypothetical protein
MMEPDDCQDCRGWGWKAVVRTDWYRRGPRGYGPTYTQELIPCATCKRTGKTPSPTAQKEPPHGVPPDAG